MDKRKVVEKVRRFAQAVALRYHPSRIILFGSYAKGSPHTDSDIDVAVIFERIDGDFLALESQLYILRNSIDVNIEPVLLEEGNDRSGFLEEVVRTGELIYSKAA
ncbi:MAG TPA: nucleotidyltransferase domain-containing protein [bacterium]|nr:nucleotidyltransferase domain-containing protein [bacterium]